MPTTRTIGTYCSLLLLGTMALTACDVTRSEPPRTKTAPNDPFGIAVVVDSSGQVARVSISNREAIAHRFFVGSNAFKFSVRYGGQGFYDASGIGSFPWDGEKILYMQDDNDFVEIQPGGTATASLQLPKAFLVVEPVIVAIEPTNGASGRSSPLYMRYHVSGSFWDPRIDKVVERDCVRTDWGPHPVATIAVEK